MFEIAVLFIFYTPIWILTLTWKPLPDSQVREVNSHWHLATLGLFGPRFSAKSNCDLHPNPFGCKMVLIRCIPCLLSLARAGWGLGRSAIKGREIYTAPCRIHLISGGFTDLQLELLSTVYMVPNSYKTQWKVGFCFH